MVALRSFSLLWLASALLLSWYQVCAAPIEVMLLTTWDDALERYGFSGTTYGVRFATKNSQNSNQKWIVDSDTKTIRTPDGYCLAAPTVDKWNFEADLLLILDKCQSPPRYNQVWTYNSDMTFRITLTKNGGSSTYCLDADAGTRPNLNVIHGWGCSPSSSPNPNQQWKIFYPGYQIMADGKCIGISNDNTDGEAIKVLKCDNHPLQMWKYDFFNGVLRLGDPSSQMCADSYPVGESGIAHMWHCDTTNENQQIDFRHIDGLNPVRGYFFVRDTNNCLSVDQQSSRLVSAPCSSQSTVFSLLTDFPGTGCDGKTCRNGGICAFGRCRCAEGYQGDDCSIVGKRTRIRASNGRFLTVTDTNYGLEFALINSQTRQQVWYHFPTTDMIRVLGRRMCIQASGSAAELTTCRPNEANQRWTYDLSTGRMVLKGTNRCLDVNVRATSAFATVQDCSSSANPNQVWEEISPDATAVNSDMFAALIRHRTSASLCWTVVNGQLVTAACQATANQLWSFNDAYTGAGALCNGELCTVAKLVDDSKGTVILSSYDGQRLDQRFEYESGTGQIRMVNTNACIAKTSDGTNKLLLAKCASTDTAQQWYIAKLDKCLSTDFLTLKDRCVMGKCEFGRCQCQVGFEGPTCSYDSCSLLQCNNGGTCSLGKCTCKDGYAGTFCDDFIKCKGVKCLNGGSCSRAGKCECPVGFSGDRCHIKHPNVLLRALEYQAIGVEGGLVTSVVPDLRKLEHQWIWDSAKSMLRAGSSPTMCLEQLEAKDVGVALCDTTKTGQKWVYNAATGKLSASTGSLVVGFEESVSGRYRPRLAASFEKPNGLDLGFVEMDRLDLPGSSLRNADRTKCLTLASSGTLSVGACNADDEAQQWEYHPQNGVLRLPRIGAAVCLTVNGASVSVIKCNGEDAAQQFDFDFTTKRFRNRKTSNCLSIGGGSVTAASCSEDPSQVLRAHFRGFCDVINMCEGDSVCSFGRCSCASDRTGTFCEVAVSA